MVVKVALCPQQVTEPTMATPTTSNIKYEMLEDEDEGDTSEEGSEIIIITPIHSDREDDDTRVLNIVLSANNNIRRNSSPSSLTAHLPHLTNNDSIASSMPAFSAQPSCASSTPPPPPYEGAEASPQASGTTTSLNLAESESQDMVTLMMISSSHKMSPSNGAVHQQNVLGGHALPSYDVATDLPSYEEAERSKEEEMRRAEQTDSQQDEERNNLDTTEHLTSMAIGTDWTFLCTFIISFLFNWIGFLLSLCITSTISGRCGALSGLGLSVVKWVAIVKHSNWASGFAEEESWLWWSLMICGFLLFIRGCVQYIHIKYEWKKIAGRLQQFYFF